MNISYNWLKEQIDIELPPAKVGEELTRVGLAVEGIHPHGDDFVFDIDLTSNRPDCLSHRGVARELSVSLEKPLTSSTDEMTMPMPAVLAGETVTIKAAGLCSRFTARIIRDVTVGPSPQWLVDRLEAIGERSINNVADITNYVMHELGQPMHSFDLDKLAGRRIVVRRADAGETITTLDEVERKLDSSMLAICDADRPVAVAGIMGGIDSGITDATANVLLEVAYFQRSNIRATSRSLNLATEASYRFERGVDIDNLVRASNRATQLICELAGGTADDLIDIYPTPFHAPMVKSNDISAAVKRLTGLAVDTAECERILAALGIHRTESDSSEATFVSPSWRHDIAIEEDLVEEISRHAGYENIAEELPPAYGAGEYQRHELREKAVRQTLVDHGFNEALSYSFIDTRFDYMFQTVPGLERNNGDAGFVTLNDSVIEGAVRMRHTIIPGLLDAVRLNLNHQRRDIKLFELGKAFAAIGDGQLPEERQLFAFVITGNEISAGRAMPMRETDFYDAKGALEAALDAFGSPHADLVAEDVKHLRRGQSAAINISGKNVGYIGRLADDIATSYKFKQPVFVGEIDLQEVLGIAADPIYYQPLPKFPGITRDVSVIAGRGVEYSTIKNAIIEQKIELCRGVSFVDVYEGKGMADGERSTTIRLEYRSDERTLVDSEIDTIHLQILSELERRTGAKPRF
ncbi:MAG: phenylalanine--tRNA ligase subunit beta [Pyrinomonadaceae bacterium]|nr:phenylalanine--tRNA ligase subunit beta [Pyrinomonadaceae bacterium]